MEPDFTLTMPHFLRALVTDSKSLSVRLNEFQHKGDLKTNSSGAMSQSIDVPWEEGIPEIGSTEESSLALIDQKFLGSSKIIRPLH